MQITQENAREAGAAAGRLLHDPFLAELLDEMISESTQQAINGATPELREQSRALALAVIQMRANLTAVFENWQSAAQQILAQQARE